MFVIVFQAKLGSNVKICRSVIIIVYVISFDVIFNLLKTQIQFFRFLADNFLIYQKISLTLIYRTGEFEFE